MDNDLKIGIISRCDYTGLAIQSKEFYDHIQCKALVVDISNVQPFTKQHFEWYPDQQTILFKRGQRFQIESLMKFLRQIKILVCFETPYDYSIIALCKALKIKTVIQPNYEFLEYGPGYKHALPDLFIAPSMWNYDKIPGNKIFLPVPVNTKKFFPQLKPNTFVHIVGKPAVHDRNGTYTFFNSLLHVKSDITVIIRSLQQMPSPPVPKNVKLIMDFEKKEHYQVNYSGGVMVMPRKFGGNCLPVNEALAAEMPVIMTDISPNNLWLPKEWLIPARKTISFKCKQMIDVHEGDAIALARKIDEFCDPVTYLREVERARQIKQQISWEMLRPIYLGAISTL